MTRQVKILRGLPRSGKSTWANALEMSAPMNWYICSADKYFETKEGYVFKPEELPLAHKACQKNYLDLVMHSQVNLVVDNTNLTAWEISYYYQLATCMDLDVEIVQFECPFEKILKRKNCHNVPVDVLEKMFQTYCSELLPPWWKRTVIHTGEKTGTA
jgi:predicted kinase